MVWFEKNFIPVPSNYQPEQGACYARELAEKTQVISLMFNISGWVLIIIGIILGVAGSVLGTEALTGKIDAWDKLFAQRGLICNTFAVIIAGVGRQFLGRAKAAATLASIATNAIASSSKAIINPDGKSEHHTIDADRRAYDICVNAKAIWLEGRVDDTQLREMMSQLGHDTAITESKP